MREPHHIGGSFFMEESIEEMLERISNMKLFWSFAKIRDMYVPDIEAYKKGVKSYLGALYAKRKVYEDAFAALPCNIKATTTSDLEDEKIVLTLVTDWHSASLNDGRTLHYAPGFVLDLVGKTDEENTKEIWELATLLAYDKLPYKAVAATQIFK